MDVGAATIIFQILILLMSVVIHEVSHGFAALWQGDPTAKYQGRLTLNPIKHLDPIGSVIVPLITALMGVGFGWAKPVPVNPYNLRNQRWGELWVALAGPLSNIGIAVIFGLALRFLVPLGILPMSVIQISGLIVIINLVLAVFNLIPIPPLDGSKVLFALLPARYQWVRAHLEQMGFLLIIFVVIFLAQLIVPVVSVLYYVITGGAAGVL